MELNFVQDISMDGLASMEPKLGKELCLIALPPIKKHVHLLLNVSCKYFVFEGLPLDITYVEAELILRHFLHLRFGLSHL